MTNFAHILDPLTRELLGLLDSEFLNVDVREASVEASEKVPTRPMFLVSTTSPSPHDRRYSHTTKRRRRQWFVTVVSNSVDSVVFLSTDLVTFLDAKPLAGDLVAVAHVGPTLHDTSDKTQWRYSCTIELLHFS